MNFFTSFGEKNYSKRAAAWRKFAQNMNGMYQEIDLSEGTPPVPGAPHFLIRQQVFFNRLGSNWKLFHIMNWFFRDDVKLSSTLKTARFFCFFVNPRRMYAFLQPVAKLTGTDYSVKSTHKPNNPIINRNFIVECTDEIGELLVNDQEFQSILCQFHPSSKISVIPTDGGVCDFHLIAPLDASNLEELEKHAQRGFKLINYFQSRGYLKL